MISNPTSGPTDPENNQYDLATLKTMMHKVLAGNLDLRHQISVLASQITLPQSGMNAQLGGVLAQMVNLSQQAARANSRAKQTTAIPAQAAQPAENRTDKPKIKPTLKLSLQKGKSAEMATPNNGIPPTTKHPD